MTSSSLSFPIVFTLGGRTFLHYLLQLGLCSFQLQFDAAMCDVCNRIPQFCILKGFFSLSPYGLVRNNYGIAQVFLWSYTSY
jgi:hypothetical protein